jgi:hypothetical protein
MEKDVFLLNAFLCVLGGFARANALRPFIIRAALKKKSQLITVIKYWLIGNLGPPSPAVRFSQWREMRIRMMPV